MDENEFALRAILGQQVSTIAARTLAGRLVAAYGPAVEDPGGELTHGFPSVSELLHLDPARLAMPAARRRSLQALVQALSDGHLTLDAGSDWNEARQRLLELPGIGPWTAEIIAMRGLGDPDAFPASDLGLRSSARGVGLPDDPRTLGEVSARWRPWRSYATQYLWTALDHSVNQWPPKEAA